MLSENTNCVKAISYRITMGRIDYIGVVFLSLFGVVGLSEAQLQLGFYAKSCPRAEKIVLDYVNKHIHNGPSLAASFLRMHFHDCFVRVSTIFHLLEALHKTLISVLHFVSC